MLGIGQYVSAPKPIQNEMVIGEELIALFRIDPEGARARFQEIRVIARQRAAGEVPQVNISADQMKRYSRARSLRGKPAAWQNKYEEIFSDQIEASFTVVEERIASDTETVNWLISCVPSIAEYTGIDGKTEFDDDVDITVKEVDGGRQTSRHSDAYRSLLRTFDGFINKFQEVVDTYEDELALAETDPIGDLITTVESLGLVRCWENSEDGILWFNDPENDQNIISAFAVMFRLMVTGVLLFWILRKLDLRDPKYVIGKTIGM